MPVLASSRHRTPHLMRRAVVLLLCLTLGLQWTLLQGIAWTGMFLRFAQQGSVMEAVEKTFDGRHACPLCLKVKEGSQHAESNGQSPDDDDSTKELEAKDTSAVLVGNTMIVPPAGETISFAPLHAVLIIRHEMPEPPPPRRGQA